MSKIQRQPLGYSQPSLSGTVAAGGTALLGSAGTASPLPERALITAESGSARWRDDGTAPTATVGFPLAATGVLEYDGNLQNLKMIAQSGTCLLSVALYGGGGGFNA